ncbi:hypothetical protein JT359_17265 [Candidatus Poribacteria bacterium]|nr:hypothetical protein [Candidatus Poribacteria bacterium]
MYPKVLWCQEVKCERVFDYTGQKQLPNTCRICKKGQLIQLRWIKVHRCGHIEELKPPYKCQSCKTTNSQFRLDTRGSERISGFRWICCKCQQNSNLFGGICNACNWQELTGESDSHLRQMSIEVHRSGRTYYPHYVELLNQPGSELNAFLNMNDWQLTTAASFFDLPQMQGQMLMQFPETQSYNSQVQFELSDAEVEKLRDLDYTNEQIEKHREMQMALEGIRQTSPENLSTTTIGAELVDKTGVPKDIWREAGQELLEAILPTETGQSQELFSLDKPSQGQQTACKIAKSMGIEKLTITTDFPMTLATFGFSRVVYEPNTCILNSFSADSDHQGKFPIFVDTVQADAIIVSLDPNRVWRWLIENKHSPILPLDATNHTMAQKAYFVQLFSHVPLHQQLTDGEGEALMVFGLLHTMSHLFVKRASLLCGLDRTSLAEYVLPRALSFAVYCGHSQGATIGALASLFEQSPAEWLSQIFSDTRRCVYDPVCHQQNGGNCHACTHLAETSCRFFNLNLGRSFLFGGPDEKLGEVSLGFFDPHLNQEEK